MSQPTPAGRCPTCGRTYPGAAKFCPEDGARLVPISGPDPSFNKLTAPAKPQTVVSGGAPAPTAVPREPSVRIPASPQPGPSPALARNFALGLLAVVLVAAGAGIGALNRPASIEPKAATKTIEPPVPDPGSIAKSDRPAEPTIEVSTPKQSDPERTEPAKSIPENRWTSPFFDLELAPGWEYLKRQADATYTGISFASPDGKAVIRIDRTDPRSGEILPFIEARRKRFAKGPAFFREVSFAEAIRKGISGYQWNFDRLDAKRGVLRKEIFYFSIENRAGAVEMNAPTEDFERHRADFESMFDSLDLSRF